MKCSSDQWIDPLGRFLLQLLPDAPRRIGKLGIGQIGQASESMPYREDGVLTLLCVAQVICPTVNDRRQ